MSVTPALCFIIFEILQGRSRSRARSASADARALAIGGFLVSTCHSEQSMMW